MGKTTSPVPVASVRALLLTRRGLSFVADGGERAEERYLQAFDLELAALGYVASTRLRARLATLSVAALTEQTIWTRTALAVAVGADQQHEPLFRRFPDDVPLDTEGLWVRKVLVHFLQGEDQPCLFCRRAGTCHALQPCHHVVCDRCFDGSNYSACPVCERQVDRSSPFFRPAPDTPTPTKTESVRLKLIDLGDELDAEAKSLFVSRCQRKQAMSPDDRTAFESVLREYGARVLSWIPEKIPVRENVAIAFGTLLQFTDPDLVLPVARRHLATATDVLRLVAAMSGADPSLQGETAIKIVDRIEGPARWWGRIAEMLGAEKPPPHVKRAWIPVHVRRFKVAKLRRPVRRALLTLLEGLDGDRLVEDMLRHRSYWVWIGEFLHPHEYADRFPKVAKAFGVVRKFAPDGTPAPRFETYSAKLEKAVRSADAAAMTRLLRERPGELARRFDHALRVAGADIAAAERLTDAFTTSIPSYSTPVLLTLRSFLPTRVRPAPIRVFWPKGQVAKGVAAPDHRAPLDQRLVSMAVRAIEVELLRRFAEKPHFDDAIVDVALRDVVAPFNERTASPSAVALPRGSRVAVASGKVLRLFLHWCQPEVNGRRTDLDLSVAFYDASWNYVGVCSYYQHQFVTPQGVRIAASAGDRTDAPFPDGATEFVDVHVEPARQAGIRYAVAVVNAYAGMPFSLLERAFAGLMLRDDVHGPHFDPRTVELKFSLQGENGVYLPLVYDIADGTLHWLDVHAKGQFEMNNVKTSNSAIAKICPDLIAYFGSGVRTSMYDLALLHAASRARRVRLRSADSSVAFARRADEDDLAFLSRVRAGVGAESRGPSAPLDSPVLAVLHRGDLALPQGSVAYSLFREQTAASMSASDLIS